MIKSSQQFKELSCRGRVRFGSHVELGIHARRFAERGFETAKHDFQRVLWTFGIQHRTKDFSCGPLSTSKGLLNEACFAASGSADDVNEAARYFRVECFSEFVQAEVMPCSNEWRFEVESNIVSFEAYRIFSPVLIMDAKFEVTCFASFALG